MTTNLNLKFRADTPAFEDDPWGETRRVVAAVIEGVEAMADHGELRDANGVAVGYWALGIPEELFQERYESFTEPAQEG